MALPCQAHQDAILSPPNLSMAQDASTIQQVTRSDWYSRLAGWVSHVVNTPEGWLPAGASLQLDDGLSTKMASACSGFPSALMKSLCFKMCIRKSASSLQSQTANTLLTGRALHVSCALQLLHQMGSGRLFQMRLPSQNQSQRRRIKPQTMTAWPG